MMHYSIARTGGMCCIIWCATLLCVSGCKNYDITDPAVFECRVIVDGHPTQDVRVVLMPKVPSNDGRLEGITNHAGVAAMQQVSGTRLALDGSFELRAAVESLGDWHIAKPWSDIDRSPLFVNWTPGATRIDIDLPKKAVKSL